MTARVLITVPSTSFMVTPICLTTISISATALRVAAEVC